MSRLCSALSLALCVTVLGVLPLSAQSHAEHIAVPAAKAQAHGHVVTPNSPAVPTWNPDAEFRSLRPGGQ